MILQVDNLKKSFGFREILAEVSFTVDDGESVGIFGKNGAGKTTLLRMIARISSCDGGDIKLKNRSLLHGDSSARKGLLYIGHQPNLYPTLTGEENLELVLRLYRQKVSKEEILSALDRVGLIQQRWDPIRHYSRGMLQRLGLAKTILLLWKILLMDEPTAGLDESGIELLESFLHQWQEKGRSMLIVSHNRSWLERFCRRILHLEDGQMIEYIVSESLASQNIPIVEV